ncbi:lipocalin-like domain-containing protein [Tenacibaculum xiamenense]|uniref:lipocalin family protein n=1 Tax=Tenacibaculum xiamenense TaxID=1261553 RepID=UPI00389377ED
MKKALAFFVLAIGITMASYAQDSSDQSFLTSGKWKIESLKIGEEKEDFSDCKNSWLVFQENGSYKMMMRKNQKLGQWTLENNEKLLKFENQGAVDNFKILKLTEKELLFSTTDQDIVYTMTLKR